MLAKMYGYTEERFRKMNSLGATERIYSGQKLRTNDCVCPTLESTTKDMPLPYEAETGRITTATQSAEADVYFRPVKVHQVKGSDTLFSIAKQYNTSVERIMELNGLKKGDAIKPNQKLYVQ
jgi:LysM repeat protein